MHRRVKNVYSVVVSAGTSSFTLMGINITILVVASLVVVSILGVCVIVLTVYCICYRTSNDTIPTSRHSAGLHDTSNHFQSEYDSNDVRVRLL